MFPQVYLVVDYIIVKTLLLVEWGMWTEYLSIFNHGGMLIYMITLLLNNFVIILIKDEIYLNFINVYLNCT